PQRPRACRSGLTSAGAVRVLRWPQPEVQGRRLRSARSARKRGGTQRRARRGCLARNWTARRDRPFNRGWHQRMTAQVVGSRDDLEPGEALKLELDNDAGELVEIALVRADDGA